ncbi:nonribosomal peptide synthase [Aspergillus ustus]|uniref:Nonribosomal peptide synthase n=1 Tax=Aspergillus ustus TaxID=40382 RepID=A0A0C1E1W3_ASPUT|nr:nonribosomal peptide synthase [Aspergillus ustus]
MAQNILATANLTNQTGANNNEAIEQDIREICAEVLRRPLGKIKLNRSFVAQGGDSLLAIKLMARCAEAGYTITIHNMLQATSLRELCQSAKREGGSDPSGPLTSPSALDGPAMSADIPALPLTGAQRLYASVGAWDSKLFQVESEIAESTLFTALKSLVSHHQILRAKIVSENGTDRVKLTNGDGGEFFAYRTTEMTTDLENGEKAWVRPGDMDGQDAEGKETWGSLLNAVVFVQQGTCLARYVRLDLHRAIADATSWDILHHDLQRALLGNAFDERQSNDDFGDWVRSQTGTDVGLHTAESEGDSVNHANGHGHGGENGHTVEGGSGALELAVVETDAMVLERLGDKAIHDALRTEPEDFVIAALSQALASAFKPSSDSLTFNTITSDRPRAGPGALSTVVGCFDTVTTHRILRGQEAGIELLRRVKDERLGFATESPGVLSTSQAHYVLLNLQTLRRVAGVESTLLHEIHQQNEFSTLPPDCLAYVEPFWQQDHLKIRLRSRAAVLSFDELEHVAGTFRASLKELVGECEITQPRGTLSDFPFLKLTYPELDDLVSTHLLAITSDPLSQVEQIFPCAPRQEAFLVAQAVYPDLYQCSFVVKINAETSHQSLDFARLQDSWARLVDRHPALRTIFIESPNRQGHFDQVVLKSAQGSEIRLVDGDQEAATELASRRPVVFKNYHATHKATLCRLSASSVYLRLDMSHTVVDGQSAQVLLRDLSQIYSNQKLSNRVMAYRDFVDYQARLPVGESMEYWSNYLSGAQPSHFPLNGDPLGRQDIRNFRSSINLGPERLGELCGKFNVTPANICQVAWALVLRSYTGLEDICFSYATSGRDAPLKGINNAVGAFLNAVICRVRVPSAATVSQALLQAKSDFVESLSHQYYSATDEAQSGDFARLKGNTLMSCQRKAATELQGSGLGFELIDAVNPNEVSRRFGRPCVKKNLLTAIKYDMSINIYIGSEDLEVMIDYWSSRLEQRTIETVLRSFEQAFISLISGDDTILGHIDVTPSGDIAQLQEWSKDIPPKVDYRIHDKVYEQRLRQPEAWAVQGWDGDLTYEQLDNTANKLASYLISLGVKPETKIPICFDKSKWAVVSQLAILKAGGCVVPLGTKQPISRTKLILKDLEATIVLTTDAYASRFTELVDHVVIIREEFMAGLPDTKMPDCSATADNCAFIIYTSGSTGVPKGVVLPHSSLCTSLQYMGARFKLGPHTRTVQFSAYTFDISIQDIYTTWHYGGCLVIISEEDRISGLAPAMVRYEVNCAGLTSTVAGLIFPQDVPSLKTMVLLGEAVKPAVVEQWIDYVEVFNAYGPSECSMQASINRLTPGCNALNIGYAFAGALWVVDPNDYNRLVPIGAPGELLIEGPLQARGYLNDPVKTAAAFVTDAAWMINNGFGPGRRLYRTGDLVQQNQDGSITYIGRRDTQIKVRGQRVEVGEIEHHLLQQDAVLDAAIIFPRQGPCQDRLVGLLTLRDFFAGKGSGQEIVPVPTEKLPFVKPQMAEASEQLSHHVSEHMLPKIWIPLESMMPQNDSSKLDRKKLGQWLETIDTTFLEALSKSSETDVIGREPETLVERQIQNAWADVLRLPTTQVPVEHKSFLSIGGDSITAMHVVSWLRSRGVTVAVRDVLESKSIALLAQVAKVAAGAGEQADAPFPVSPIQQWYLESIVSPDSSFEPTETHRYNTSVCLVPRQKLDFDAISEAIKTIVSRHPVLRSRFQGDMDNGWRQRIASENEPVDVEHLIVTTEKDAERVIASSQTSLNLQQGPVFSTRLINFDGQETSQILFVTAHRLVVDEVSWDIIRRDLNILLQGQPLPSSSPPPFQTWTKIQTEKRERYTNDSDKAVLPYDVPRPDFAYWGVNESNTYGDEVSESVLLDESDTKSLIQSANSALRTEPVEILLSALFKSFDTIFGDRQVPAIFVAVDGRETDESGLDVSNTVGLITSMVPVHIRQNQAQGALATVQQTKDARRSILRRGLPFIDSRLLASDEKKSSSRYGPMEILFRYVESQSRDQSNELFDVKELAGGEVLPIGAAIRRPCAFEIVATLSQGRLKVEFKFNRKMSHQQHIHDWLQSYATMIRTFASELSSTTPTFTSTDFLLVNLTPETLKVLQHDILPAENIKPHEVEDIYPCSPIQQGILMSQVKSPSEYFIQQSFEIVPTKSSDALSVDSLLKGWQTLVDRHPMLRTRFVRAASGSSDRMFDQVVLKSCKADVAHQECSEDELLSKLAVTTNLDDRHVDKRLGHKLIVYSTPSNRTYGQIIVSHALVDASSLMLIQKELAEAYDGKLDSHTTGPSYSGYISYLEQTPAEQALEYWTNRLAQAEPCYLPALTADGTHPAVGDETAQRQPLETVSVEIDCVDGLHKFTEAHGLTTANIFQLAWALVLAQYTGSTNVSFGYLSSGRDIPVKDVHQMIGPLINMMVTHIKLDPEMGVERTLRNIQDNFFDSFNYQRAPLIEIWHALKLQGQSLFNTALSYRHVVSAERDQLSLSLEQIVGEDPTEYDVTVSVFAATDAISASLQYSPDFMAPESAKRLLACLQEAIRSLVSEQDLPVVKVNILPSEDVKQVCEWNDQILSVDGHRLIHDLFSEQRQLRPNETAICAWDGDLTYQELDDMSNQLAHYLASELGVGPEVMVALCIDKSRWAIIAQLSVLKAGGVVVSVNPKHPSQRLELILQDINSQVMLTSEQYSSRFTYLVPKVLHVNGDLFSGLPAQSKPPTTQVTPDNAAFIIYTSGSTGMPKGVILTHLSLCSSFRAHGKVYGMAPTTRSLQFAAYTFDASISDIWGTMSHGGCVCVISEEERMNNLQAVIEKYEATHAQVTPTVAGLLDVPTIKSLTTLILGGEAVREAMIEEYAKAVGRVKVLNGYGPSECSIYTTCSTPLVDKKQALNIGRPLVGTGWVIANNENVCPVGAVGELWVEGPLLGRGYHNDQKKTDASFVTNPKWAKTVGLEGHRFYNTGDLVRQTPNGDLVYQARKDSQVKIRGQRVEVGEIEYRVKKLFPAVKSLVASLINPGGNSSSLVVSVAMELDEQFLQRPLLSEPVHDIFLPSALHLKEAFGKLHASLSEALPSYMLPTLFIPVDHLPHTASSKLDRRTLKQMLESLPEEVLFQYSLSTSQNVAPTTDMEMKLQSLWATILNVELNRVSVQDHFLHLGGDSFTAMRLVSAANSAKVPLTVGDIFRFPKLQDMAAHLEEQVARRQATEDIAPFALWKDAHEAGTQGVVNQKELQRIAGSCKVTVDDIEDVYPCTPLQEGLLAITTQQPGSYIGRWVFRIRDTTDGNAFKKAWTDLTQAIPILRTRIVLGRQSGALQVVVRSSAAWGCSNSLRQYLDKDLQESFVYGQPLVRQAIVEEGNENRYFVLTAHHSAYDGYSLGKLFDAVSLLYDGKELPPTPSISRFISYLDRQDQDAAKYFWQAQLEGELGAPFPSLPRPSYRPRPTQKITSSTDIGAFGGRNTLASTLRAAWALAISANGGNDVLFGVALSGRAAPVPGILDMPAPTITTVPVRVHINPGQSVQEYLSAVHQQSVDMIPFEHTGLQNIRRFVGHEIDLAHLFAVQPAQEHEDSLQDKLISYEHGHVPELNLDGYALTVECITSEANDGNVKIQVHFDEEMITTAQTQNLLSRFCHLLGQLVKANEGQDPKLLGELEMLSRDEATQLAQFNKGIPLVKQDLVHELVSQHVAADHTAPAVCSWDGNFTRGELDHHADKLAQHLTSLGVQPETMVALCLDKSKWALVANLAVLKAGGAVVPIRADPIQRVHSILQQTGITTIIASESQVPALQGAVPNVVAVGDNLLNSLPTAAAPLISEVTPSNAAFVIFTSGSTGTPKGVVLEHGAMSTSMQAHGAKFGMNAATRAFNFAHFTFDISLHDIISTLQFGGCVCFPSEQERVNDMAGAMRKMGVNYSFLPPRVIHTIKPSDVPDLKTLVVGGEAVQAEHLEPWLEGVRVFNAYGPAECCIASTCNEVANRTQVPNIGRAIAGGLWVVDENDYNRLLPLGAVGELLIEGPLLARGYLNDPAKTSAAFISNPAWISQLHNESPQDVNGEVKERRMYRTGDLVRQTEDGSLVYVGRSDGQVKIRGQRVEIGEIEHHISEHSAVVENVIVYPRRGPSESQLVGILTMHGFILPGPNQDIQPTPADQLPNALKQASLVRDHLHTRVPEYMIPHVWVSLTSMPHNTSDKIDRRRLTQWLETMDSEYFEAVTQTHAEQTTTPSTPEEQNILAVWADVLHVPAEKVSLSRPFLSVGGDSVTAMQVVSRCRAQYRIYVTVRDVLQSESITQLAKKAVIKSTSADVDSHSSTSASAEPSTTSKPPAFDIGSDDLAKLESQVLPRCGIQSLSAVESICHCSPIQQGILMSQIKDSTTYQVRQAGEIKSVDSSIIDMARILKAWEAVVQRHSILRTFFVPSPSGQELFYQVVLKDYAPNTRVQDSNDVDDFLAYFADSERPQYGPGQPQYQLTLSQTPSGQVFAQVDVNHVLMDASSMDLILNDLILAYDGCLTTSPAPSYGTYVSFIQQTSADESLKYWTERLANAEPSYLPSTPGLKAEKPELCSVSGEIDNIRPLHEFRDAHGVTLANIAQLAWAVVLSRYVGSEDVTFGYLSNGRDAPIAGIDEMVGPMINLIVTRIQLGGSETTVAEAAKRVQDDFLDSFAHQRASLGDIQHALRVPDRGLFNTTMIYKPKPIMNAQDKRSLTIESLAGEDPTEYDVQIKIVTDERTISMDLEYATSFMERASASRLLESLKCALASIAANPQRTIGEIDVIPAADIESLHEWNSAVATTVRGTVHDKIHQKALSQPSAQAVCGWDGGLTYAQLTDLTDRLADHLSTLGVHREVMVGLCFDKSMWTVVLVLTSAKHASKFCDVTSAKALLIDDDFLASLPGAANTERELGLTSDSAAVVIYTSGSTGLPKGVVLTHGTICTSIESHGAKLNMGTHTRALQYSAYVFDLSLLDIFSTLRFGGCVCVVSEEDRVDINSLTQNMEAMSVNLAVLTPTVAGLIDPKAVPTLSTLVLAGEAVPPSAAETWAKHVILFNGYGPAECTILATANGPIVEKERAPSVGTALAGAIWVVETEDYNRLAPIGVVGELLISGPLVARGYLNDPERTAQSFITDPAFIAQHGFNSWAGQRMYKTGDLVRQDPADGSITYVGRADGQVKVRGQRVEVGEIEYWIKRHFSDAHTVAAGLIKPRAGDAQIVAAIELQKDHADSRTTLLDMSEPLRKRFLELQATLSQTLPSFMIPSKYIPIQNIPLTASGKIDRRALRGLLESLTEEKLAHYGLSDSDDIAPRTETERRLADLWAAALNYTRQIGSNAHFFRLGGDSVTAMRLVALARSAESPLMLTVGDIFKHQVLSDMASFLDATEGSMDVVPADVDVAPFSLWASSTESDRGNLEGIASQCNVALNNVEDVYPCTPLQEGLMAITAQHSQAYISHWVFRLDTAVDVNRFTGAWSQLYELAPILRTRIVQDSKGSTVQVIVRDRLTWTKIQSEVQSYISNDYALSMSFGDPLMRFAIVTSGEANFFVWTAHHSTYDGWTARKLMEAAWAIYLDQPTPQFLPFNRFAQYLQTSSTDDAQVYWQSQLAGGMGPSFPETPKNYSPGPIESLTRHISANDTNEFTISTLLRAAWALILSQETGSNNVGFATALSGRTAPVTGILDVMGPTITTVPVRVSLDPTQHVSAYLDAIQQQATDMLPFEHTGLHNISKMASVPFNFQHLFVIQPAVDRLDQAESTFEGVTPVPFEAAGFHSYPLVIECNTSTDRSESFVDLQLQFDPTVVSPQRANALSERFHHVFSQLQGVASGKENKTVADVSFIPPEDLGRIQAWNQFDDRMAGADACIHGLVYQQQLSRPDAQAVCAFDGNLTYRELDDLSSRLAYHLVDLGVGPEVNVATIFEKTKWAVVTYLGILKAGGTIVPINHQHPRPRVEGLIANTKAEIILTSQGTGRLDNIVPYVLTVNEELLDQLPAPNGTPFPTVKPTHPAFIIFTSGSTGIPKGVVLQHTAIVSSMTKGHGSFYASPDTRALQFSAFNFDISIAEIFTTLSFGGCVCVISEDDRVSRLPEAMEEAGVNFAILTPTIANLFKPEQVPSLKKMLLVGEALRPEVAVPWIPSHVELYNAYGPAEASILTTFSSRITDPSQAPNIGFPLAHSNLFVVDPFDYHKLLPIGMVGELLIEGPLLARGYLGDDQKTAEAFFTDPAWLEQYELGSTSGRRFYRTGDLVQQKLDGSFIYIGRRDTQVKIHGQRVEIGEIEFWVKTRFLGVREVAVNLFNPTQTDEPILAVAMEVPASASSEIPGLLPVSGSLQAAFGELRRSLLEVLPSHMVPQLYLPFAKLPLTDSGKLNRRATWEIVQECTSWSQYFLVDEAKVEPSTETERLLQNLWSTALKVPASSIGARDDFFRSGGDSISAMRLVASAREHANLYLTVADVFKNPVLSDMATAIDEGQGNVRTVTKYEPFSTLPTGLAGTLESLLSMPGEIVDAAPVTDLQSLAIATSLRKSRDLMAYVSIDGAGTPDIARWKASCLDLVKHHDALRTAYVCYEGQLVQVVLKDYTPGITHFETDQPIEEFSKQLIRQDMNRPPQLGQPFLEFAIITSKTEHRILFRLSHAEYDAISLSYFVNTLQEIYQKTPVTEYIGFPRYVSSLAGQNIQTSRDYWRTLLKGSSMPAISAKSLSRRLPARQIYHAARRVATSKALPAGITTSTVMRAAWAHTLANHVGKADVIFGEVVSGRSSGDPIAQKAAGCCANMVPVRASVKSKTVRDLLQSLQKQLVDRLPHESLGFRDMTRSCTDLPPGTLFSSLLNHLDGATEWTLDLDGGKYSVSVAKTEGAGDISDVSVTSTAGTGYVEIAMAYLEDGITAEAADTIFNRLCETVDKFVNGDVDAKLEDVVPSGVQCEDAVPSKFEGDLIDASVVAFELQKRGVDVTVDDVVEQGLTLP